MCGNVHHLVLGAANQYAAHSFRSTGPQQTFFLTSQRNVQCVQTLPEFGEYCALLMRSDVEPVRGVRSDLRGPRHNYALIRRWAMGQAGLEFREGRVCGGKMAGGREPLSG